MVSVQAGDSKLLLPSLYITTLIILWENQNYPKNHRPPGRRFFEPSTPPLVDQCPGDGFMVMCTMSSFKNHEFIAKYSTMITVSSGVSSRKSVSLLEAS